MAFPLFFMTECDESLGFGTQKKQFEDVKSASRMRNLTFIIFNYGHDTVFKHGTSFNTERRSFKLYVKSRKRVICLSGMF